MKKLTYSILLFIAITYLGGSLPNISIATTTQPPTEYEYLAPLPNPESNGVLDEKITISDGSLSIYLNRMIKLVVGISAVLGVLMIVMGGIEYMGGELISNKESGKEKIFNAILGLVLLLSAYAILYTINPSLLNGEPNLPNATVEVDIQDNTPQTPVNGTYTNGKKYGDPLTGTPAQLPLGVSLNNGWKQCTYIGEPGCTSTIGLNMDKIWTIKNGCNCNLTITGGTEWWKHGAGTTHQEGSGTVDLRTTNELTKYFTGSTNTPAIKTWYPAPGGGYALYEVHDGVTHWHYNPKERK